MGELVKFPTSYDPVLDKRGLGRALGGYSVRWVEAKLFEGMPSSMSGGRRVFRLSEVQRWLEE